MCKPEARNVEQSEEVCHQGWRFTLLSQGMEEGNVAIQARSQDFRRRVTWMSD